jgi:hypothetical protein
MISRVFQLSRSDSRFDQTRTGTIILKTYLTNIPPEVWQRWDQQVFTGNRVRLVAILRQLPASDGDSDDLPFALTNVREVILQRDSFIKLPASFNECEHGGMNVIRFFKNLLPNLDILDIGALALYMAEIKTYSLNAPISALYHLRASVFRCTAEVVYPGCHFRLLQPNPFPADDSRNILREIHIDPLRVAPIPPIIAFCQEYSQLEQEEWFDNASNANNGADWVLLQEYPNLERVTLKNADYSNSSDHHWKELPQEALIKFVRHSPNLRWFCSDLTQDNIAILKEERPEVVFCS